MGSTTPEPRSPEGMTGGPTPVSKSEAPETNAPMTLTLQSVHEPLRLLFRDLRTTPRGLSSREAARRLVSYGPNELRRRGGRTWHKELARQFTHPLALLLWGAAALALLTNTAVLAAAIVGVIVLNAGFSFWQEQQAERAVEALADYLPHHASVLRDGRRLEVEVRELVPGDVLFIEEGDAISADARLLEGVLEVDMSALTGESTPVERRAGALDVNGPILSAPDLLFSGTVATSGMASALVYRTGMSTELGRIAALTERIGREESPLERQVRRVAWLIATVAITVGIAFLPIGLLAGLPLPDAIVFAVGLLVANVPEGLLPTITLSLAMAVRELARHGALVRRLSAVETLGCTDVICTDKTGTQTHNRMTVTTLLVSALEHDLLGDPGKSRENALLRSLAETMAACTTAELDDQREIGDPTEVALLKAAAALGAEMSTPAREARRQALFRFDPVRRLMSTVDSTDTGLVVHTKGAPESVMARCSHTASQNGSAIELSADLRAALLTKADSYAARGLRLIALAAQPLPAGPVPQDRDEAESDLVFLGIAGLMDPPRPEVPGAVNRCHEAGIRINVITGDHAATATAIAAEVNIGEGHPHLVPAETLEEMSEEELDHLLRRSEEIVFSRAAPEIKLRIADALRSEGHVVAMT